MISLRNLRVNALNLSPFGLKHNFVTFGGLQVGLQILLIFQYNSLILTLSIPKLINFCFVILNNGLECQYLFLVFQYLPLQRLSLHKLVLRTFLHLRKVLMLCHQYTPLFINIILYRSDTVSYLLVQTLNVLELLTLLGETSLRFCDLFLQFPLLEFDLILIDSVLTCIAVHLVTQVSNCLLH